MINKGELFEKSSPFDPRKNFHIISSSGGSKQIRVNCPEDWLSALPTLLRKGSSFNPLQTFLIYLLTTESLLYLQASLKGRAYN